MMLFTLLIGFLVAAGIFATIRDAAIRSYDTGVRRAVRVADDYRRQQVLLYQAHLNSPMPGQPGTRQATTQQAGTQQAGTPQKVTGQAVTGEPRQGEGQQ